METIAPTPGLFELSVDSIGHGYLKDAARWAKFLAIVGFIFCAFFLLFALLVGSISDMFSTLGSQYYSTIFKTVITVCYAGLALLNFFPCLYLYNFGTRMQVALRNNDQEQLNRSFKNMRSFYRFVGVMMIIGLCVWALSLVVILVTTRIPHNTGL